MNNGRDCQHGQHARACPICEAEGERDQSRAEVRALTTSLDYWQGQHAEVRRERDELSNELTVCRDALSRMKSGADHNRAEAEKLRAERDALARKLAEAEASNATLRAALRDVVMVGDRCHDKYNARYECCSCAGCTAKRALGRPEGVEP